MTEMTHLKCKKCHVRIKIDSAATQKQARKMFGDASPASLREAVFARMAIHSALYHEDPPKLL